MAGDVQFAPESTRPTAPWKVLVVDDEPEVHQVTRLVLGGFLLGFVALFAWRPSLALWLLSMVFRGGRRSGGGGGGGFSGGGGRSGGGGARGAW